MGRSFVSLTNPRTIAGFVLAGGASTRMGQDKALLAIQGVPMASRVASVLVTAGCDPVALVGRQPELHGLGWTVIPDPDVASTHHPLLGIGAALHAMACEMALFVPCDLISIRPDAIKTMLVHNAPCVASSAGRIHPLVALLPKTWAKRALEFAAAQASVHSFVEGLPNIALPESQMQNANHPEDLPGLSAFGPS